MIPRLAVIAGTIVAGLASRRFDAYLPGVMHKNTGDVLWATLVFWLALTVVPRYPVRAAFGFAFGIEFLKLMQHPWLERVRQLPGARLVFGYAFSWTNLVCYAIGIGLGFVIQKRLRLKGVIL